MTIHFWAKSTPDGQPGISVYEHMLNVGHTAYHLTQLTPDLPRCLRIGPSEVSALAALHDLGKISPGFQQKCRPWLEMNHLMDLAKKFMWERDMESDHGQVTHAAVQDFLIHSGTSRTAAKYAAAALGGHHGKFEPPSDRGFRPRKAISEKHSGIEWDKEREDAALAICAAFEANLQHLTVDQESPALWWLAGLTSVADWIGSDERFFSCKAEMPITDAMSIAKNAITHIGLLPPDIKPGLTFHELFHDTTRPDVPFNPNDMQTTAMSTITAPGVYVIEAPMGTGKTEAALWAAYQLLADRKARGIYFALPTQATSNRMHLRMADFVRRIAPITIGSRLIHGSSWLLEQDLVLAPACSGQQLASNDARVGRDWFASAKRAILAPFGVGTVDQALLGVVAAKHFFVRRYALAGKVVILDEVHSYDIYTGTLIDKLISMLEQLGCTVIVLSATLSGKRRRQIIAVAGDNDEEVELPYPVITGRRENVPLAPVKISPPLPHEVEIVFRTRDDAMQHAIETAERGGCVIWICNTVATAQTHYQHLQGVCGPQLRLGLLHSRFPFWRREQLESDWMERLGKSGMTRCGSILVSTQIVEQSVDLDADLLVTELAPTDMLLQRIGRLWRHQHRSRPTPKARLVILNEDATLDDFCMMSKSDIIAALGGKAYVYDPYVLLRTLSVWKSLKRVVIPRQIRTLIEATYEDREDEPESWLELLCEGLGKSTAYKQMALQSSNIWTIAMKDDEGVQTRLNEFPTISLVLCDYLTKNEARFLDGSTVDFQGDDFRLATAQALYRNSVNVPAVHFKSTGHHSGIARYLRNSQCVGLVDSDGMVNVEGLKDDVKLRWSANVGITIESAKGKDRS